MTKSKWIYKLYKNLQKERTQFVNLKIVSLLKIYKPLINHLEELNNLELTKFLYKLSENLTYRKLLKGLSLKKLRDEDSNLIEEINFNNKWIFFLNNKVTNFTRTFLVNQFLSRNKRVYERLKESISF